MAPYLQKAALSSSSSAIKELNAKKLRERVLEVTGGKEIELARIRRVDLKSILTITIVGIITFSLYSLLSGVDFLSIIREIRNADSALILLALLLSPIIQVFFALSTVGAARRPVRYFPALMLQYAIQFIAVTMPATAARMAMNIRFFQKRDKMSTMPHLDNKMRDAATPQLNDENNEHILKHPFLDMKRLTQLQLEFNDIQKGIHLLTFEFLHFFF